MRRAVDRNRFKRVVRERLRRLPALLQGYDVVIRIKRPVKPRSIDEAAAEAGELAERLIGAEASSPAASDAGAGR